MTVPSVTLLALRAEAFQRPAMCLPSFWNHRCVLLIGLWCAGGALLAPLARAQDNAALIERARLATNQRQFEQAHADLAVVLFTEDTPLELIRARRVVEGEIAALAAVQAKRRDTDAMARAIDTMRADADRNVMPLDGDRAFHTAIVQACGNVVLLETVQGFWDSRRGPLFERLGGYFETVDSWRAAIAEHEAIHAAIRERDPDAARSAMHSHLDKSHSRFSASWRRAKKSDS